ncbi:hypothetical protein [Acetobacter orientalis]|uniref:hypothetical protein n=1 Tax=Acetobacter orientalis TaxID=146474 RepID=UPI0039E8A5A5
MKSLSVMATLILTLFAVCIMCDGSSAFVGLKKNILQATGYSEAKAACVASEGSEYAACVVAQREDETA